MSGCTENGKPLISIVMAVYEPNMQWLCEQLLSLNAQTYPNLELRILDDCSPTVPFTEIQSCVQDCISAFSYTLERNAQNLGSNKTFEALTLQAEGELIAYCDQDDVWLPEKLEKLQRLFMQDAVQMGYSDMSVMDGAGQSLAVSLRELRPRLCYVSGFDLAETYFFRNCTAGCSMLVSTQAAKAACPFPRRTVCDQWVALLAAKQGAVAFVDAPLVRYRMHGGNQTGILTGIFSKADYREHRLAPLGERLDFYRRYANPSPALCAFVTARLAGHWHEIWKYRKLCQTEARFELAMRALPEPLFRWILRKVKHKA